MRREEFSALMFSRKQLTDLPHSRYRVYSTDSEFKTVEAPTASDALQMSGLPCAHRIVRELVSSMTLMDAGALRGPEPPAPQEAPPDAPAPEAVAASPPAETVPAPEASAEAAPVAQ